MKTYQLSKTILNPYVTVGDLAGTDSMVQKRHKMVKIIILVLNIFKFWSHVRIYSYTVILVNSYVTKVSYCGARQNNVTNRRLASQA